MTIARGALAARILLATAVLGAVTATSTTALTLAGPGDPYADLPAMTDAPRPPPVSGADVLEPTPERSTVVTTSAVPVPEAAPDPDLLEPDALEPDALDPDDELWTALSERMRESVRVACADGRLEGRICERA